MSKSDNNQSIYTGAEPVHESGSTLTLDKHSNLSNPSNPSNPSNSQVSLETTSTIDSFSLEDLHCCLGCIQSDDLETLSEVLEDVQNLGEYEQKYNLGTLNMALELSPDHPEIIELLLTKNPDINFPDRNGSTPLHKALEISKSIGIRLISMGANLHLVDESGWAPIHLACLYGLDDIVELLLVNGVSPSVSIKDKNGQEPIHIACERGSVSIVELLLANGVSINTKDKNGMYPIHFASVSGNLVLIKLLLNRGANIHEKTFRFDTPLIYATMNLNYDTIEFLLNEGSHIHDRNHLALSPILVAAESRDLEVIRLLLSRGANIHDRNMENLNPIMLAVKNGYPNTVEFLLESGQKINTRTDEGDSLIILSVKSGNTKVVNLLVKNGADIDDKDSDGETLVSIAIRKGFHEILNILLSKGGLGTNVLVSSRGGLVTFTRDYTAENSQMNSYILLGARSGHSKVVDVLMKRGANIHYKDSCGSTPMSIAIENGFHKIVDVLLSGVRGGGGANFERDSGYEISLIEQAMNSGHVEVVKVLHKNNAITRDELNGYNILTKSIKQGHIDIFKFLIQVFPRFINSRSGDDLVTPLMRACVRQEDEYFDMLLKMNPKIDLVDSDGMNAIMYACRYGSTDFVDKILKLDRDNNLNLINNQDSSGKTALMHAGQFGSNQVLVEILSFNPSLDVRSMDGKTALMYAVEHERESIVNILLSSGASKDIQDNRGKTVLFIALEKGYHQIASCIICSEKSLEIRSKYYRLAFLKALELRNRDVIRLLLDKVESGIIDINKQLEGEENFLVQLLKLDLESSAIPYLIDRTDNLNARDLDGKTCIMVAFTGGRNLTAYRKSIIKKLLERGADIKCIDTYGLDCLAHIVTQLDPDALQYFFELFPNSCDGTNVGLDLLLKAFSLLTIEAGSIQDFQDHQDNLEDYKDIYKLLLNNGAGNKFFNAVRIDIETCRMLLETIPDCLSLTDTRDYNSLMIACEASNLQVIELLLSKENVDINYRNREGYSSLMIALNEDKGNVVQLLKDKGADTTDTDDSCPACLLYHPVNKMVVSGCGHKHCRPCYLTMRSKPLTNKCSCCRGPL
jgi:ankyrin repeat protein